MIRRSKPLKRGTRVRPVRSGGPRRGPKGVEPERWRNRLYLGFLRSNGICIACKSLHFIYRDRQCASGYSIDPAHGPVNGTGSKGPDAEAIPLCRWHHDEQHAIGWPEFEKEYSFSREKEAAMWWTRFKNQS